MAKTEALAMLDELRREVEAMPERYELVSLSERVAAERAIEIGGLWRRIYTEGAIAAKSERERIAALLMERSQNIRDLDDSLRRDGITPADPEGFAADALRDFAEALLAGHMVAPAEVN